MRLLYVPDQRGAVFFLWGTPAKEGESPLVRALKRRGRRAAMAVVDGAARLVETSGSAIALAHALPLLMAADPESVNESASVLAWVRATRLVSELLVCGRLVQRRSIDAHEREVVHGVMDLSDPEDIARVEQFAATLPHAAFAIPMSKGSTPQSNAVDVYPADRVLRHFIDTAGETLARAASPGECRGSTRGRTEDVRAGDPAKDAIPSARPSAHRLRLRLRVGARKEHDGIAADHTTTLSHASPATRGGVALGDICEFRWEAALGERSLTLEEFQQLAESQAPLVLWRDEWVRIDQRHVQTIQPLLGKGGTIAVSDALRAMLSDDPGDDVPGMVVDPDWRRGGSRTGDGNGDGWDGLPIDVRGDDVMTALVARLTMLATGGEPSGEALGEPLGEPLGGASGEVRGELSGEVRGESSSEALPVDISALSGTLRPYQLRGVRWLATMSALGFGGCLADDMGLGKTIQILAFLLHLRATGASDHRPSLIVCPTSVAENWVREAKRFAPSLPVVTHYGTERGKNGQSLESSTDEGAVVVTTYPTLRRDASRLRRIDWRVVVFDEAQQLKNSAAQVSAVARTLRASHRFALTGTPVENRLGDLWSILNVTTPGILGTAATFKRAYAIPIEKFGDVHTAERLRRVVAPFILRRVKSDPAIITDLPAKQERDVVCTLTEEQAGLYQAVLDDAMQIIVTSNGIARKGHVLALITALKQICNHPAQYLRDAGVLEGRSGKLTRLGEMLGEVIAEGERALVFTQFRDMGGRLVEYLRSQLDCPILYLHGSTPVAERAQLVERFQEEREGPAVFVLSLKAGGTGLNLTAANHVFHFDRWWNPAVEDQATDRAYRIGQGKPVQVHKLVTAGTIEEKISLMLGQKRELSQRVVGAPDRLAEQWITELDSAALQALVALSATGC